METSEITRENIADAEFVKSYMDEVAAETLGLDNEVGK